jgi:hypothetical protein
LALAASYLQTLTFNIVSNLSETYCIKKIQIWAGHIFSNINPTDDPLSTDSYGLDDPAPPRSTSRQAGPQWC